MKWTIHFFWSAFLWTCINAHCLYTSYENLVQPISMRQFLRSIVLSIRSRVVLLPPSLLIKGSHNLHPIFHLAASIDPEPMFKKPRELLSSIDSHVPVPQGYHSMCDLCKLLPRRNLRRTSKTSYCCTICNVSLHKHCFHSYHSTKF